MKKMIGISMALIMEKKPAGSGAKKDTSTKSMKM